MIFFFFLEFSSTCGNSRRISLSPVPLLLSPFSPAIVLPTFSRGKLLKRPVELYWLSLFSPKTELVFLSFSPLFVPSLLLILSCSLSLFFSLIQVERFSSTSRQFDEGGKEGKKEQRFIKKKKKKNPNKLHNAHGTVRDRFTVSLDRFTIRNTFTDALKSWLVVRVQVAAVSIHSYHLLLH